MPEDEGSYTLIRASQSPPFFGLENYPFSAPGRVHTHYLVFRRESQRALLPYAAIENAGKNEASFRSTHCPWQHLLAVLHDLENHRWAMVGRLFFLFTAQEELPRLGCLSRRELLSCTLIPVGYGYLIQVSSWAHLRPPDDFPISPTWLYQTQYLVFQQWGKQAFFPYRVIGRALESCNSGEKKWESLAQGDCQSLLASVKQQLSREGWEFRGQLGIHFMGTAASERELDLVQFLFTGLNAQPI